MTPFSMLIIGHLIGDFLFQTGWIAKYKSTKWLTLFVHVSIYTGTITMIDYFTFQSLSFWGIGFIFVSHCIIDRKTLVDLWMKNIMRTKPNSVPWLSIVVDQIFHVIALAVALAI